jgi:hypothetical protein
MVANNNTTCTPYVHVVQHVLRNEKPPVVYCDLSSSVNLSSRPRNAVYGLFASFLYLKSGVLIIVVGARTV